MSDKLGRNDPCSCGSGKKYKQCCLPKKAPGGRRKIQAKWVNKPAGPNLIERTFGNSIDANKGDKPPTPGKLNFTATPKSE